MWITLRIIRHLKLLFQTDLLYKVFILETESVGVCKAEEDYSINLLALVLDIRNKIFNKVITSARAFVRNAKIVLIYLWKGNR